MPEILPGVISGFLFGALAAFLNYRLTLKLLRGKAKASGLAPTARVIIDAAALAAVYFITPFTPLDRTWTLVGTAAGLTLPLILLTPMLLRSVRDNENNTKNEKDDAKEPPEGGSR